MAAETKTITPLVSENDSISNQSPKADWIIASLRGAVPPTIDELSQMGLSMNDFQIENNPEDYWASPEVKQFFTDASGNARRDVFDGYYENAKKTKDYYNKAQADLNNSAFLETGAQTYLSKWMNKPSGFSTYTKKAGLIDPWGRNEMMGQFSEKKWGLLEKGVENGVRLESGKYINVDDYDGLLKIAKDDNGFLFDEKGLPYWVPVKDNEELKTNDVVYNKLAYLGGYYGHDYGIKEFLGSVLKAPVNFISTTIDSLVEIPKVLVQAADEQNAFVDGANDVQNYAKSWKIPTTESGQESIWSFENLLDQTQQVAWQLAAMAATGGATAALTGSARLGSIASRSFMLGITAGPVAQVAKDNNLSPKEAALMMLATAPFLYKAQQLSEAAIRGIDPTKLKAGMQQILQNEYKATIANGVTSGSVRKLMYNTNIGFQKLMMNAGNLNPYVQGAVLEAIEETSEQVVDLVSRLGYNLVDKGLDASGLRESDPSRGYQIDWMNEINNLGFAAAMGAGGGAIGSKIGKMISGRFDNIVPNFQRGVFDIVANGQAPALRQMLMDSKSGKIPVTFDAPWLAENGDYVKADQKSRNDMAIDSIMAMVNTTEDIVEKSGYKQAIRNNEDLAGNLREALKESNIGADYRNLIEARERLDAKIKSYDKTTQSDADLAQWNEEMKLINQQLDIIKSGVDMTKYLEEGMYNVMSKAGKFGNNSAYLDGKSFYTLNANRAPVMDAMNQKVAEFNNNLSVRDTTVTLDDFKDEDKGSFTDVGKQKLVNELGVKAKAEIDWFKQNLESLNQLTDDPINPAELEGDPQVALKTIVGYYENNANALKTNPELEAAIVQIVKGTSKTLDSILKTSTAKPKEAPQLSHTYKTMTKNIGGTHYATLVPIQDKLDEELDLLKKSSKDGVSLYDAGNRVEELISSINARIAQVTALNDVATAINPKKLMDQQIPLMDDKTKKELLEELFDNLHVATKLKAISAVNNNNAELQINKAMGKFLDNTLQSYLDIGEKLAQKHPEVSDIIGGYIETLNKSAKSGNTDEFLKELINLEEKIHQYGNGKSTQILSDLSESFGKSYSHSISHEGKKEAKMYNLLRGVLSFSTAKAFSAHQDVLNDSNEKSLNPTVQQSLISIRAVQNMLAEKYEFENTSSQPNILHFTTMVDADPGAGKTKVVAAMVAGMMQKITNGKVFLTAKPDNNQNERKNNLINAVNSFFRVADSGKSKINLTNDTKGLIDFIKSGDPNADTSLIIFDEATLLSNQELAQISVELNKQNNIRVKDGKTPLHLLFIGDTFQKTVNLDSTGNETTGVANPHLNVFPRTERIDFSFRIQNNALRILNDYFKDIQAVKSKIVAPEFDFSGERGVRIINDKGRFTKYVEDRLNAAKVNGKIADYFYITDQPSKVPASIMSSGVKILTPEEAQGKEKPHVIIDLSNVNIFNGETNVSLKQDYYTSTTRAEQEVIMHLPSDQGLYSREGVVSDIKPLMSNPQTKEQFNSRFADILGNNRVADYQKYQAQKFTIVNSDDPFKEGTTDDEAKQETSVPQTFIEKIQGLLEKNNKDGITGYSYVTIPSPGQSVEEAVSEKLLYLNNTNGYADKASFNLVLGPITQVSAIKNTYGANDEDLIGTPGAYIEGVNNGKGTIIASLPLASLKGVDIPTDSVIRIPLGDNPLKYATNNRPWVENKYNVKKHTLGQMKDDISSNAPGLGISDVLIATESINTTGAPIAAGKPYFAVSHKYSSSELNKLLNEGINGKFDDDSIRYIELDTKQDINFNSLVDSLKKYVEKVTDDKGNVTYDLNDDGFKITKSTWSYLTKTPPSKGNEDKFRSKFSELIAQMLNVDKDAHLAQISKYYDTTVKGSKYDNRKHFDYILKNYAVIKYKQENKIPLTEFEKKQFEDAEYFLDRFLKLPYFTYNGLTAKLPFKVRRSAESTGKAGKGGNPNFVFADKYSNPEIYNSMLSDDNGGITYPYLKFNQKKIAAMLQKAAVQSKPATPTIVKKAEVPITNTEAPLVTKTEKIIVESTTSENMGYHDFFANVFKQYDTSWFTDSIKEFKKSLYESIYVLKGETPKVNTITDAIKAQKEYLASDAQPLELFDPKDKSPETKKAFISSVLATHFNWYLNNYFPAIKQDGDEYIIESKAYKTNENYERDNFSLLEEGITTMVWTQLGNTPIYDFGGDYIVETGKYIGKQHVEELVSAIRMAETTGDYENILAGSNSDVVKSFYFRFLKPEPYNVNGEITHSFNALKNDTQAFDIQTAMLAAMKTGEIFRMAGVDLENNSVKLPGAYNPTNIKEKIIGALKVAHEKGIKPIAKKESYTDEEVVKAMQSLGIYMFDKDILNTIIKNQIFDKRGIKREFDPERTKKRLMDTVYFKMANFNPETGDISKLFGFNDIIDTVAVIEEKYGITSNLTDLDINENKVNRLRRTSPIFYFEALKIKNTANPESLNSDNLLFKTNKEGKPFFEVSSEETALKDGIRLNPFKRKSNAALTASELLEQDMYYYFTKQLESGKSGVLFSFVPFSDSSSDFAHLVRADWSRSNKDIAKALFDSRRNYYGKLERQILSRWNNIVPGVVFNSMDEVKAYLLTNPITKQQLVDGALKLYKNLDYTIIEQASGDQVVEVLTINPELINTLNAYRNEANFDKFYGFMESRANELIRYAKEEAIDSKGKSLFDKMNKDGQAVKYIKSFHFNWVAYSTEMDKLFNGPIYQYKGKTESDRYVDNVKRARSSTSNGAVMVFRDRNWTPSPEMTESDIYEGMKLPQNIRVAYVTDIKKPVVDYSGTVSNLDDLFQELFDGMTFVNPAMRIAQRASFGGDFGTSVTPVMKNITTDLELGPKTFIKNADSSLTPELLRIGNERLQDRYRKMLSVPFPEGNPLGMPNALALMQQMGVNIQTFENLTDEIIYNHYKTLVQNGLQDYMIMEIIPDTSAKTGMPRVNNIDGPAYKEDMLNITNRLNLLDASKDPSGGLKTTILSQYINAIVINWNEPQLIENIFQGLQLIAQDYNKNLFDIASLNKEELTEEDHKKLNDYIKSLLVKSVNGREDFTYQTLAINEKNFNIQDRQILNSAVSAINSNISDNVISLKFQGGQYILHPQSEMFEVYQLPDGKIRLKGQPGWEQGKPRDLAWENPVRQDGLTLMEAYQQAIQNGPNGILALQQSLQNDVWSQGYAEIVAPADMAKEFSLARALDENRAIDEITVQYFQEEINEKRLKGDAGKIYADFLKRLEGIQVRIPTTGKHSAIRTKIVAFVNGSMNSVFVPKELLFVQGADQDIDKGNYLTYESFDGYVPIANPDYSLTPEDQKKMAGFKDRAREFKVAAIKNRIVQSLIEVTGSPKNLIERNTSVKVVMDPWKAILKRLDASGKAELSKEDYLSYARSHETNQAGKAMVGVFANGQKAYQVLYQFLKRNNDLTPFAGINKIDIDENTYNKLANKYMLHDGSARTIDKISVEDIQSVLNLYEMNNAEFTSENEINELNTLLTIQKQIDKNKKGFIDNTNGIWRRFSGLINAATDNAKEQILGRLGISMSNGYIVNYLVATGKSEEEIYNWLQSKKQYFDDKARVYDRFDSEKFFNDSSWKSDPDLYKTHRLAKEYDLLSKTIMNRETPNGVEDMYNFRKSVEKFVNESLKKNNFNFILFLTDDQYANQWMKSYDGLVKLNPDGSTLGYNAVNILRVYKEVPHLAEYLKAYASAYQIMSRYPVFSATEKILNKVKDFKSSSGNDFYTDFEGLAHDALFGEHNYTGGGKKIDLKRAKFKDINDFVYGLVVDAYLKSRGGKFGDISELDTIAGRKIFVENFNEAVKVHKAANPENAFLKMLQQEFKYEKSYPVWRILDIMKMNQETILEMRNSFTQLPSDLQNKFFLYSLITSKDKPGKGAINQIFGPEHKIDFVSFLDVVSENDILKAPMNFVKDVELYASDPYNSWINYESAYNGETEKSDKPIAMGNNESRQIDNPSEYTNHSGGADGADSEWDSIGREFGVNKSKHYYAEGEKTPKGNTAISKELLKTADQFLIEANKTLKRKFPSSNEYVNNLLRRNYWQVSNADAVFAVSTISNNIVNGGTGWAVQMAVDSGKPTYVFDQNEGKWFTWKNQWIQTDTPVLTKNFAGIGTREINEKGKNAIRSVYNNTFRKPLKNSDVKVKPDLFKVKGSDLNLISKVIAKIQDFIDVNSVIEQLSKLPDLSYADFFTFHTTNGKTEKRLNILIKDFLKDKSISRGFPKQELTRLQNILSEIESEKGKLTEEEVQEKIKSCGLVDLVPF